MRSSDIDSACNKVQIDSERLNQALDNLKYRIESSSEKVHQLSQKANEIASAIKNPGKTIDHLVNDKQSSAREIVSQTSASFKNDIKNVLELSLSQVDHSLEQFLDTSKNSVEKFLQNIQGTFARELTLFKDKPLSSWALLMLGGFFVGFFAAQKLTTARRNHPKSYPITTQEDIPEITLRAS